MTDLLLGQQTNSGCNYKKELELNQVLQHEATRSITTPLDGMLVHHRVPKMK